MIIGIDPGIDEITAADRFAFALPRVLRLTGPAADGVVVATHTVQVGHPRFALSVTWPGPATAPNPMTTWQAVADALAAGGGRPGGVGMPAGTGAVATWPGGVDALSLGPEGAIAAAWVAVLRVSAGDSGRVVVFPGADRVRGVLSAADAVAASALTAVTDLDGAPVSGDTPVTTADFVRPRWRGGSLVLQVQPGPQGATVPFERAVEPDEEL
jgi:hypothetical protein